jgi:hypothetical protein
MKVSSAIELGMEGEWTSEQVRRGLYTRNDGESKTDPGVT